MAHAFRHHVWATTRLIDACTDLSDEQPRATVSGTYGPIIDTMRHLVGTDSWYLLDLTGDPHRRIEDSDMDLSELRVVMERDGSAWATFLATDPDPDAMVKEIDETDGYERDAPIGIRLAQALNHGTDHRSQICTALTSVGVEPPSIDAWDFGVATGAIVEVWPAS
jgi:uncharacterized damage-inducible protein DinB